MNGRVSLLAHLLVKVLVGDAPRGREPPQETPGIGADVYPFQADVDLAKPPVFLLNIKIKSGEVSIVTGKHKKEGVGGWGAWGAHFFFTK